MLGVIEPPPSPEPPSPEPPCTESASTRPSASVPDPGELPASLRWAAWLLLGEAVAGAGVAGLLVYQDLTGRATNLGVALGVTGFAIAGVVALLVLARALLRRRPHARGPAIVGQLMLAATAYYMIQGGLAVLGVPIIVLALLVCALLVSSSTTRALGL